MTGRRDVSSQLKSAIRVPIVAKVAGRVSNVSVDSRRAQRAETDGREELPGERIIYLAPDCTDSAVRKRAHAFVSLGHELLSFSFRRDRYNVGWVPDWPNIELGKSEERRLTSRALICLRALWIVFRERLSWRRATVVYARNLDLALLALVGKLVTRCQAPLVYEVLDIHPILTRRDMRGAMMRWLERRVLRRCDLLVVSSPAYLRSYFHPVQGFQGTTFLLENKRAPASIVDENRNLQYEVADHQPVWTIGWFGNLRCQQTLDILTEVADELPDRVKIYMRGCASLLGEEKLSAAIDGRANMVFAGEYDAPDELATIYSQVHFNWCGDFSDGVSSVWLLPNRIYEGGYFGIPAIAIAGHETGRIVDERGLGVSLAAPFADGLKELLLNMNRDEYVRLRESIEAQPASNFVTTDDMAQLIRQPIANR